MSEIVNLLMETAAADIELLIKNAERGDQCDLPRQVDFLLRSPTAEKAALVAGFVNDYRYGNAKSISDESGHRVEIMILMPTTEHVLCCVSGFMTCLSKIYGLEYDGWGSTIENPS